MNISVAISAVAGQLVSERTLVDLGGCAAMAILPGFMVDTALYSAVKYGAWM